MSKKIAILFSGGLDSTYLMWKALKDGHDVFPIYIEIRNNADKSLIEMQQCKSLIDEFNKEFDKDVSLNESVTIDIHDTSNIGFAQPYLWSTLSNIGFTSEMDELQIGYVYGDAVVAYLPEIRRSYGSAKPFVRHQPKLTFPIIKTHKDDMVIDLPEQYLKLVVSCENPKLKNYSITNKETGFKYRFFEPCGHCEICKKIINNNYYGCKITKKNYSSAEKLYNESKYDEFKNKYKGESSLSDKLNESKYLLKEK